jgi:hypothetical protein
MSALPKLDIARVVTQEHGKKFTEEWFQRSDASCATCEAFTETGLVVWPDGPDDRPAQMRYHDIEDEISERVYEELRKAVEETFVRVASDVLARERGEQAMKRQKPRGAPATPAEPHEHEHSALDPIAPQTEYQHVPGYYETHDIPHVLARVRNADRFFGVVNEKFGNDVYQQTFDAHLDMLAKELQPYALALAQSLINLEDSLREE